MHFLENHDQIANSGGGERGHRLTSPARWRALTALLLLGPQTPMLFQSQEFAASAPFLSFADQPPALARQVQQGRLDFTAQFTNLASPEAECRLPAPHERSTWERCQLDHAERERPAQPALWRMHQDLLRLRREPPALQRAQRERTAIDGAVLADDGFVLRCFGEDADDDLLLVVNLGRVLHLDPAPEPLLAPPDGCRWAVLWSSQDPRYGGIGTLSPGAGNAVIDAWLATPAAFDAEGVSRMGGVVRGRAR